MRYLKQNKITLVGTFSRKWCVDPWFSALQSLDLPREYVKLLIYCNSDNVLLEEELVKWCESIGDQYSSVALYTSKRKGYANLEGYPDVDFDKSKLKHIWLMWNDIKDMITTETFMLIEDDTLAPKNAFWDLFKVLMSDKKIGLVTAIETGRTKRHWIPVRLGVHYLKRKGNKIIERISLDPNSKGIKDIDASGVYCFVARTDAYKSGFVGMEEYIKEIPFFAIDNILTNNIKRNGWKIKANFNVWCDHLQLMAGSIYKFNKKNAVPMADLWIDKYKNYAQGIIIRK